MHIDRRTVLAWSLVPLLGGCAATPAAPSAQARDALAPTGRLRVGLIDGAPANFLRDPPRGIGYELGAQLARRLQVPFEPVLLPSVGAMLEAGRNGGWDVTFNAITAERLQFLDATPPHLRIAFGYLVPPGSRIARAADVDQPGVRVAFPQGGSIEGVLAQALKQARLVPAAGLGGGLALLRAGAVEVFASNLPNLHQVARSLPGATVLDETIGFETQGLLMPRGRHPAGLRFASAFMQEARRDGLVQAALERAGMRGASVVP